MRSSAAEDDARQRYALIVTALAPLVPQLLGCAFNIWYNLTIIDPLLRAAGLRDRFVTTIYWYNAIAYTLAVGTWVWWVFSLRPAFRDLYRGERVPEAELERARRRLVHLPWVGATISAVAWLSAGPAFLFSLWLAGRPLDPQLYWHLPISFVVSGFIAMTQSFFLIELASHWGLFPVFFRDARADRLKGIHPISLRTRGLMWAVSIGICPIGSLLLLSFAPLSPTTNPQWFGVFVGTVGIAFGLSSAVLIGRSVAHPIEELRAAARAVTEGDLSVQVPLHRVDEFGSLIGQFNRMVTELRDKERLRRMFGAHVGRKAAEEILARDPGVGGIEQEITVMFVDIRSFTARAAHLDPQQTVAVLNEFLAAMVEVVEGHYGGMINQFTGDGFMALFGVSADSRNHADTAVAAARAMLQRLEKLNAEFEKRGQPSLAIGIGINTGPAIVGSVGSPERMEFTSIGTTVNVASRIESLNKPLGTSLLISRTTRDALQKADVFRALPPQPVKGVDQPVEVFTPAT
ncbi:MAG TPA: adenylate/guanylate cyclase domain-containing protein [Chthoniobacterales bacterium]|nr:adenylate/guanylate cyclase domain-containing protein [Chthoniobacterales bacterium]